MPKKKLCVDFDDTIVESIFLKRVNRFLKTNYTAEDFKNYYIDDTALGCPLVYPGDGERPYVDWEEIENLLERDGVFIDE